MGIATAAAVVGAGAAVYSASQSGKGGSSGGQLSPAAEANARQQTTQSADLYNYYKTHYQPLEGQAIDLASAAGSPEMQEQRAARAGADVKQQTALAQTNADHNTASLGLDPSSGKAMALKEQGAVDEGANVAGAMNAGREAERQYGLSAKLDTAGLGRNLVGQSLQATANSTNSLATAGRLNQTSQDIQNQQAQNIGGAIQSVANVGTKYFSSPPAATGNNQNAYTDMANAGTPTMTPEQAQAYDGGAASNNFAYMEKGGKVPSLKRMKRDHTHGGSVTGPGSGTSDSVPVTIDGDTPGALSSGEYVINAKAAKKHGIAKLDKINKLGLPPGHRMKNGKHLAEGGLVEADPDDEQDEDDDDKAIQKYAKGGAVRKYLKSRAQMNMQEGGQVDATLRKSGYKEDNSAEKSSGNGFVRG